MTSRIPPRSAWLANVLKALAMASVLLAAGCQKAPPRLEPVTFNMSWLPQGSMSGVIVALDKGYYASSGLDVKVIRGFGGTRTVNELDQGLFEFGYTDPISVALNRARGGGVRMVAAINAQWPAGLCFIKERHAIARPGDLAGLTIGGGQNSAMQAIVPAWLDRNGVPHDRVKMMQLEPSVVVASLMQGRIDAGECWQGNSLPLFRKAAQEAHLTLGWLPYRDFGLDSYGSGIITSDRVIGQRPDTVRRFIEATLHGYAYAGDHREEAIGIVTKRFPVLDPTITRQQLDETLDLMRQSGPPGELDPQRMNRTADFVRDAFKPEKPVAGTDIFSNDFLPKSDRNRP